MAEMTLRDRFATWCASPAGRTCLHVLGWVLMLSAALVGPLPGPGGAILFVAGLGLALRNSLWFKRRYVRFKRWQPRIGRWTDWGMRRESAKRRANLVQNLRDGGN